MAVYKVPQDVEADDKLLGPFSFRQFIYLAIAAAGGVVAWGLSKIFLPLAIIPAPIVITFIILALPLRKDQPMEIYAAAILSFLIKPRKRLWQPDGVVTLIEVSLPEVKEFRGKGLTQDETSERLNYLSQLVDTQGWAVRGLSNAPAVLDNPQLSDDIMTETQTPEEDVLDENNQISQNLSARLDQTDEQRRSALLARFKSDATNHYSQSQSDEAASQAAALADKSTQANQQQVSAPPAQDEAPASNTPAAPTASSAPDNPRLTYNPYPSTIRQSVIHPMSDQPQAQPADQSPTSKTQASQSTANPAADDTASPGNDTPLPGIINLASNSDLSVETIAREARRIKKKHDEDEIVLKLH